MFEGDAEEASGELISYDKVILVIGVFATYFDTQNAQENFRIYAR